ncbi:MAG: mechanosensitive ion channel family protein [archaeon]
MASLGIMAADLVSGAVTLISDNKYVQSALILGFFILASKILRYIVRKYVSRITGKTKTEVDDLLVDRSKKSVEYIIIIFGLKLAIMRLGLPNGAFISFTSLLNSIIVIIITYLVIVWLDILIDYWGKEWARRTESRLDEDILPLFHKMSKVVITIIGLLLLLAEWGIEIGPFLASLGIAGIAIGFAVKDSLANIFGGISLILDKNFRVGDIVKLENGENGRVLDIGLRSTKIRTWDNEVMIIPNGQLANTTIVNYAKPDPAARVVIPFGVEYGNEPDKVKRVVINTLTKIENVIVDDEERSPFVKFLEMADFSLNFKAYFWVPDYTMRFAMRDLAVSAIYKALRKAKIGIPFPTRTVYNRRI